MCLACQHFDFSSADCDYLLIFANKRNLSFGSGDVRGAGTRDEPIRKSAWEDRRNGDEVSEGFGATTRSNTLNVNFGKQHQWLSINILSSNSQVFLQLSYA